jgi:hypothetical protein
MNKEIVKKVLSLKRNKEGYYDPKEIFEKLNTVEILHLMFIESSYQETLNVITAKARNTNNNSNNSNNVL